MKLTSTAIALAIASLSTAHAQQITGAGGTFPAPVYAKWGEAAKSAIGIELNYQAIGSGGGQNQITNRTVDFGASDAPMDPDKLKSADLLQFPTVMGAVVVIVNIPEVTTDQLKLTGDVLADIYDGKITKWNDPKVTALNNGVTLPNLAIAPVYRAEASGTSFVFTSYLSAVSPGWKSSVGANTNVKWPAGAGAKGNDGVAATVGHTRGAIGYVENAYATQNHLITVQLRNKSGAFVKPTTDSFTAAASAADWTGAANFAVSLIDLGGANTWPIVSPTFILLPKDPKDAAKSADVMKFFNWTYTSGGAIAKQLDYIPLPASVQDAVRAEWKKDVMANGQPVYK